MKRWYEYTMARVIERLPKNINLWLWFELFPNFKLRDQRVELHHIMLTFPLFFLDAFILLRDKNSNLF